MLLRSPGIHAFRCSCRWSKLHSRMQASPMTWARLAQIEFVLQLSQSFVVDAPFVAQTDCGSSLQSEHFTANTGLTLAMFGANVAIGVILPDDVGKTMAV